MTDIVLTRSWVAGHESATDVALAGMGSALRSARWWGLMGVLWLAFACVFALRFDPAYSTGSRVLGGLLYGALPTVGVIVGSLGLGFVGNRSRIGAVMFDGAVLEAGVGDRALRLRGPWSDTALAFEGIESIRRVGDWVMIRSVGSALPTVWPAALFSGPDLARLQRQAASAAARR